MSSYISDLVSRVYESGVDLSIEGDQIRLVATHSPSDSIIEEIRKNKKEILEFFKSNEITGVCSVSDTKYNLTPTQKRIWASTELVADVRSNHALYNIPVILDVFGNLCIEKIERSLNSVLNKHKALGAIFGIENGIPYQTFKQGAKISLSCHIDKVFQGDVSSVIEKELSTAFSLDSDEKVRASIFKLSDSHFRLIFIFHHIVFDGTSANLFIREFSDFYNNSEGDKTREGFLKSGWRYFQYAHNESIAFSRGKEKNLDFWKERLEGAPLLHDVPLDKVRLPVNHRTGSDLKVSLSKDFQRKIEVYSQSRKTTLPNIFQAVFAVLLSKYSNNHDIVFGTPCANRPNVELEKTIGLFLDNLVLRFNIDKGKTFREILEHSKNILLDSIEHGDIPFEKLVQNYLPSRSHLFTPFFQIMFVFQPGGKESEVGLGEAIAKPVDFNIKNVSVEYDLVLNVFESDGGYTLSFLYDDGLFMKDSIERMLANYQHLLKCLLDNDQSPISRIKVLSLTEQNKIWQECSRERENRFQFVSAQHEFEQKCRLLPNKTALVFDEEKISYSELNERANRLAHFLISKGVEKQDRVAVYLDKSVEMIVTLLAILKAGATFVPLSINAPEDRVRYILKDSSSRYLISQSNVSFSDQTQNIGLLEEADSISEMPDSNIETGMLRRDYPAYVMYTSGSTGMSKGVEINHFSIANLTKWQYKFYQCDDSFVVSQLADYSFDASIGESFMALLNGLTLVMLKYSSNIFEIEQQLLRNRVSIIVTVPSMLKLLSPSNLISSLKVVVSVGEVLSKDVYERWSSDYLLVNGYGPTEYTVYSHAGPAVCDELNSIGKSVFNTRTFVLDEGMNEVPFGVEGDIYISGAGVANGYVSEKRWDNDNFILNKQIIDRNFTLSELKHDKLNNLRVTEVDEIGEIKQCVNYSHDDKRAFLKKISEDNPDRVPSGTLEFADKLDRFEFESFFRYLLEGLYDSYHSIGLSCSLIREVFEGFNFNGCSGVDFCCGDGKSLSLFTELGANAVGLDISPTFVQNLTGKGYEAYVQNVDVDKGSFFDSVSYKKHSMDFAFSSLALDRVSNPRNFLDNFLSSLKDNGRFGLLTILPVSPFDDGDVDTNSVFTEVDKRISPGNSENEDLYYVVRALISYGAKDIVVKKLPYAVQCKDGYMEYSVWSFSGYHSVENDFYSDISLYSLIYKTGDRGKFSSDGNLVYAGRKDELIKLNGIRIEPGEVESKLQALNEVRDALVMAREDQGHRYLAAYVLPDSNHIATGDNDGDLIALCRAHLKSSLPNYMVPAGWSVLSQWPLLPSGKINRQALPLPVRSLSQTTVYRAPQTEQARQLCAIWSSVLGLDQVGVDDNFFEIGGDSILSIQVVSQARQQGIYFDVRDLFEHQSIAQLCDVIREEHGSQIVTPQDAATGSIVLHPVQQLFFAEPDIQRHHFNQSILLSTPLDFSLDRLYQLISALYERHDALRLSFQSGPEGWKGEFQPLSDTLVKASCERVELDSAGAEMQDNLSEIYTRWQSSLSLSGPLLKAGYIDMGPEKEGQLLLAVHHLVIDGVSWRIVLNDLEQAYKQLQSGSPVALPPKTSGYGQWCERLRAHSDSEELGRERAYWQGHSGSGESWLPLLDSAPETLPVHGELGAVTISLSEAETQCLLRDCGQAYRTQVQDLLVTGLYLALREWSGESCIELDLEGHGREALFSDLDISDTVGWFTSMYPQRLTFSLDMSLGQLIKAVKEQLRAIPDHGIGYGMLRYLSTKGVEGTGHHSPLVFNYLGQFGQSREESERSLSVLPGFRGKEISDERPVLHPLALNGQVSDGKLHFTLSYSRSHISQASAEQLSECLQNQWKAVIVHCSDPQSGGYTPVDFPLVDLDQAEVDVLEEAYSKLENVYYATPMQSGMLFHSLLEQGSGLYATQLGMDLDELNVDAFKEAWTVVLSRHEALRACFSGMESERLRQIIVSSAPLSWHEQDWSGLNEADQSDRYQTYLQYDLATPFDFSQPPLMRFALFKLDDGKYRFLWTCHHTLIDGWSNPLVWQTLSESYAAKLEMRPPELPAAGHYGQYIKWLSQQDMDKAQRYWQALVSDVEGPLKLGIELPQERVGQSSTYEIREENLQLTEQETAALRELSHRTHTTLNTVFLGAWSYLLHRYSGDERVLFGTTVSGRPAELSDVESMVGLFINTLPLRVNVSQEESVWLWLQSLQSQQVERSRYEYLGLSDIQKLSAVNSGESLFDSVVIYENYPSLSPSSNTSTSATLSARVVGSHESTNYGLTAVVVPQKQLSIKLQYQTDRFSREAMARLRDHLRELLLSLGSANSDTQLKDLSLLTPAERDTLLTGFNETEVDYQRNVCVPELIEEQARKEPDRTALVFEDSSLSYGELNTRANQVAHYLLSRGLKREEIVGLCHERGFDLLVSMLGILKAGGAYVPLDPGYPSRRLAGMLEDSGARWVLSDSEVLSGTPDLLSDIRAGSIGLLEMEFIEVDRQPYRDAIGGSEQSNPVLSERSSSDLAYVIYTSGSTGRPKGVMIEHHSLVNFLFSSVERLSLDQYTVCLALTTISFDIAYLELFGPLLKGGQVVLMAEEDKLNIDVFSTVLTDSDVNLIQATPTYWSWVLEHRLEMPESMTVLCGGEAISKQLSDKLVGSFGGYYNCYGPTEATIWSLINYIDPDKDRAILGNAVSNLQHYVVDRWNEPVPVGVPGELLIGGEGLSRGYLNRDELTGEKFIANPFSEGASSRVYRTGDLVRWLSDGNLEFLGRLDHQVKIRGYRVELEEIETVLSRVEGVKDSLVMARSDEGHQQLVAYILNDLPAEEESELIRQCREKLQEQLPDFMVPSGWVVVTQWPLLPNGKINRAALPEVDVSKPKLTKGYQAPKTEQEKRLCELWSQVLQVERVGVTDNFFELGGDSLSALRLNSMIKNAFNAALNVRTIWESRNLGELSLEIERKISEEDEELYRKVLDMNESELSNILAEL
uniref:Amino acid adenylation domain n=1 Tax=Marinomonas sp. (strain MWYL1) TaxID=400668 RepID=A6VYF7_MARMS